MNHRYDVVIIGGGASGMAAAIELKMLEPGISVAIIEKNDSLGRKIRATGNGRCNITNTAAEGFTDIMSFFRRIGIVTRTYENGLVYPYSESAADVVELLTARIAELGVDVVTKTAVSEVTAEQTCGHSCSTTGCDKETTYTVQLKAMDPLCPPQLPHIITNKLILALGGKAGPNYGTTGDGYAIARGLGHSIVTPIPVLTSIECREWDKDASPCAINMAGIRARGKVSLYKDETEAFDEDSKIFEESGEIQFTKFGLSGICVFNMSRYMRYNRAEGESLDQFLIRVDLFADGSIKEYMDDREREHLSDDNVLRTLLKPELADYVLAYGMDSIHSLEFHPTSIRGWKDAQATSGGVDLAEIDPETCESKISEGLYITGELLDYDGPCGGYNLSNAWLTGLKAARACTVGYESL